MFTQTKWKSKLLTIWITLLNQLELLDHTLLSDVILNIMKCCTQKLRDRVSTIYFTIRKDAPDRGIRQVPDDNWYPAAKSVHGLGPQTRDSMVKYRLGYGGSCDSSRDQVQKLLPEISSHGPALVSLPMELSQAASPGVTSCTVPKLALSSGRKSPTMGEDLLRVLAAQLFTCKHATVVKDSALQLDHSICFQPTANVK